MRVRWWVAALLGLSALLLALLLGLLWVLFPYFPPEPEEELPARLSADASVFKRSASEYAGVIKSPIVPGAGKELVTIASRLSLRERPDTAEPFPASVTPVGATVWPAKKLTMLSANGAKLAAVPERTPLRVIKEDASGFLVEYSGKRGYIPPDACLINLPEYLENLCAYDITNSYRSAYTVHGYYIPDVTDNVVVGYEKVRLPDGGYLVPLLYPVAKKLEAAARSALDSGCRLKIYDAFRPRAATLDLYDRAEALLDVYVDETGESTYAEVMTGGGTMGLGAFLAKGTSWHNYGLALDLTLEDIVTGEELEMQTAIHDLSCYSRTSLNNGNAKRLAAIMTGAGFETLSSEWWHFQIRLKATAVSGGVEPIG